jgi:2-dehydropantoate 2-reductase
MANNTILNSEIARRFIMADKSIKTVHLIGLGAIGATYGSKLYQMDKHCFKVILNEERIDLYKQGTFINGEKYDFDLMVPKEGCPKAEFILVSVKGYNLTEAIKSITPLVGHDTIILSLLNGITSEDDLSSAFGRDKVLHGFCVGTDSLREHGRISFKNAGRIVFGEYYPEAAGKAAPVAELFSRAGISFTIPKDIRREMWWKFMMNVGINQISAVLRAPYGMFQKVPEARELLFAASGEVLPLAQKEGISLSEADISEYLEIIKTLVPESKTSMLQDIEAGRKTEVESFALTVVNLGKKYSIPTPVNEMLFRMIRVLEARN